MTTAFDYSIDSDQIVTITMDMPGEVNAINADFSQALASCIERLESEGGLTGVVITSSKKTFVAGGDINDFISASPGDEEQMYLHTQGIKSLFRRLERLPVPVACAINGSALGGGLELALCCNYRVAFSDQRVQLGLPEVNLGLLPGGGGVVRLTSMLGFEKAYPFLMDGKKIGPEDAVKAGLINATVSELEQLLPTAKTWILERRGDPMSYAQPWDERGFNIPGGTEANTPIRTAISIATASLYKKTRGLLPAPNAILSVMVEVLRTSFDVALDTESREFARLVTRPETKNMINAFFYQMNQVSSGKSRPNAYKQHTAQKIGVLGGGMMGQGIAMVAAQAGIAVVIKDVTEEAAARAKQYSEKNFAKLVAKGRMSEESAQKALDLILPTSQEADLDGSDFIIEAVYENIELKQSLTSQLESRLCKGGVWASNTSTLPITRLAEVSKMPENYIGMHFFSPVDRMPLVEIICGEKTSEESLAKAFDLARQLKKFPIVVNDSPGFYTSRTISTPIQEAAQLIAEGVSAVRVENIGKSVGWPVGPLALQDEVSQKLSLDIIDTQIEMGLRRTEDDPTPEGTALMRRMLSDFGRGGRAHGGGYYEYSDDGKHLWPQLKQLYFKSEVDEAVSDRDIRDRLLFRPVIESLICYQSGVLRTVADGNIGSLLGIGAPSWTGGYLQFVNTYGLKAFSTRCDELVERFGNRFRAPAIVSQKLSEGEGIY